MFCFMALIATSDARMETQIAGGSVEVERQGVPVGLVMVATGTTVGMHGMQLLAVDGVMAQGGGGGGSDHGGGSGGSTSGDQHHNHHA